MKKSDAYKIAMRSVLANSGLTTDERLEVLGVLMDDKKLAEFLEAQGERG